VLVIGLIGGCSGGRGDSELRAKRELQKAVDALDEAQDAREDRINELSICDARSLAILIRIAAGTWPWNDPIADPPSIAADHARYWERYTRELATRNVPSEVFRCTEAVPERASIRGGLVVELSREENVAALSRLLAEDRKAALDILEFAPTPPMRMALEPFVAEPQARRAILNIDDLPVPYEIDETWESWFAARERPEEWAPVEEFLDVAAGETPLGAPGRPAGEAWTNVRRSASQQSRAIVRERRDVPEVIRARARALLSDPDPVIRRDALRMAGHLRDPAAEATVRDLARRESDPKVHLAALEAAAWFDR